MPESPSQPATDTVADAAPRGTQTLVRGLAILKFVSESHDGVTTQQAADHVGIHRTMAMRSLAALGEFHLVHKGADGRYRIAAGATALGRHYLPALREAASPVLERLAHELESSACLFVSDGEAATAAMVIEPPDTAFHLTFKTGSRHPLDRGSAGYAISALADASPEDDGRVIAARRDGYATSHGEVEPGAYGISVPLDQELTGVEACVHVITFREDIATTAAPLVLAAARDIEHHLRNP